MYEQAAAGTMDGIIDTVSAVHPVVPLMNLVKPHGKVVMVGVPEKPLEFSTFSLIMGKDLSFSFLRLCWPPNHPDNWTYF